MTLSLKLPENTRLKPQITVFGVGGAGGNATNNMIRKNLEGANFVVANTDAQSLESSAADKKLQLGQDTTRGLGAGASPEVGKVAAEEAIEEIDEYLEGSNMVFITAGMGGGTGTGASPVIAKAAKEKGILTVAVVTKPFHFEGPRRMKLAEQGIEELQKYVDTLIIIPNQNLFRIANEKTTFADAFAMADEVLHSGVRGVTDLMVMPGLINLDFADVKAVMSEMGKAMMGTGEAEGERRAQEAAEAAISNPLLDNVSMRGARGVLINITGGSDLTLFEVDEAANRIREEVESDANIIFGSTYNESLQGKIRVSVVATGIDSVSMPQMPNIGVADEAEERQVEAQEEANKAENLVVSKVSENEVADVENNNSFDEAHPANDEDVLDVVASLNEEYNQEMSVNESDTSDQSIFMATQSVDPESVSYASDEKSDSNESGEKKDVLEEQSSNSGGFFSRFARVAKSFGSGNKEQILEKQDASEYSSESSNSQEFVAANDSMSAEDSSSVDSKGDNDNSELAEIPAFLRRKSG